MILTQLSCPSQHPFVSSVTSNKALRELVAEAKAEVMEDGGVVSRGCKLLLLTCVCPEDSGDTAALLLGT